MKTDYVLPHNLTGERQRLALMSQLLDPLHRRLLATVGLRSGMHCLEVGCGNGSISEWIARKVGPEGHMTATDIDLQYVQRMRRPNLDVLQLDILNKKLETGKYDLITARAVLHHVGAPEQAIGNMAQALKPGGVLLSIEPDFLPAKDAAPELRPIWQAWLQWSQSVGIDYFIGRTMPARLTEAGLSQVAAEGTTDFYRGGSPWATYWLETFKELQPRLLESGFMSRPMLDDFQRFYTDPDLWTSAITFVGSWGSKPN